MTQTDELVDWLGETAKGVYVTVQGLGPDAWAELATIDTVTRRKFERSKLAIKPALSLPVIPTDQLTTANKIKRNA